MPVLAAWAAMKSMNDNLVCKHCEVRINRRTPCVIDGVITARTAFRIKQIWAGDPSFPPGL